MYCWTGTGLSLGGDGNPNLRRVSTGNLRLLAQLEGSYVFFPRERKAVPQASSWREPGPGCRWDETATELRLPGLCVVGLGPGLSRAEDRLSQSRVRRDKCCGVYI